MDMSLELSNTCEGRHDCGGGKERAEKSVRTHKMESEHERLTLVISVRACSCLLTCLSTLSPLVLRTKRETALVTHLLMQNKLPPNKCTAWKNKHGISHSVRHPWGARLGGSSPGSLLSHSVDWRLDTCWRFHVQVCSHYFLFPLVL